MQTVTNPTNQANQPTNPAPEVQPEKITTVDFVHLFYELTEQERLDAVFFMLSKIEARKTGRADRGRLLLSQLTEAETAAALVQIQARL